MKEYFVWLFKLITLVIIFVVLLPILLAVVMSASGGGLTELAGDKNQVAVVELSGIIDSSKEVLEQLHKNIKNDKIKGIVLRVDSPGGSVGPSQDIYSAIQRLKDKKPIVASMGGVAASGGLYATLGASKVYAQPGTITGSIGVIMQIPNFHKVTEKVGVDVITIKSGKLKDVGNTFREMTEEEKEFLQSTISVAYQDFVDAVVHGRKLKKEDVVKFADGRVILGSQAKEYGLIDEYGDVYEAGRAIFDILGTPLGKDETPKLIYQNDPYDKLKKFVEGAESVLGLTGLVGHSLEMKYLMF